MYVGKKLKFLRQQLSFNQMEFASELGVSQPYYSAIESGKKPISNKMLKIISDKWGVDEGYFTKKSDKELLNNTGVSIGGIIGGTKDNNTSDGFVKVPMQHMLSIGKTLKTKFPDIAKFHESYDTLILFHYSIFEFDKKYLNGINDAFWTLKGSEFNYSEYEKSVLEALSRVKKYEKPFSKISKAILEFYEELSEIDEDMMDFTPYKPKG